MINKRNYINSLQNDCPFITAQINVKLESMASKAYLTPEDAEALVQAATCVRNELLVRVLFWASCRISEALGLTVDDVDPIQGTITIQHLKSRIRLLCPHCDTRLSRGKVLPYLW